MDSGWDYSYPCWESVYTKYTNISDVVIETVEF